MHESETNSLIINFCPTGMVPVKAQTPFVPVSVAEIVEQTQEAWELGITIAHLHARNTDETPAWEPEIYRDIFEGVRKHCPGLIICGSTSGRNFPEFDKRSAVIELKPDMCSLTLSSLNFISQASLNAPNMVQQLALKMKAYGVHPELECFDFGMINYGKYLIRKNLIEGPFYWNLLFGNIAGFQPTLSQIGLAIQELNGQDIIACAGLGEAQLPVTATAIAMGLGVRIGLEDNIWYDPERTIKATNLDLLKRVHQLMEIHQKKLYSPAALGNLGFYNSFQEVKA